MHRSLGTLNKAQEFIKQAITEAKKDEALLPFIRVKVIDAIELLHTVIKIIQEDKWSDQWLNTPKFNGAVTRSIHG